MSGGGPPDLFKIVRYSIAGKDLRENVSYTSSSIHVQVSESDRIKIAEILGISDPGEQKRMLSGAVYIHPLIPKRNKTKKADKK